MQRTVDLGVLPDPQRLAPFLPRHPHPHLPREHVVLGLPVGLQGPYVRPVEVPLVTEEPLLGLQKAREDIPGKVEEGVLWDVRQSVRLEHVDDGVG